MLILKGTKTVDLSKDELTEIIGQFDRVHIDLGTGDGRNIYKLAINDQNTFYKELDNEYVKQFNSLWAKRLAFGRKRSFFRVSGHVSKH